MKLKTAIQYIRISQKDQSNFSVTGQQETNSRYAERHGIEILRTYIDDGESAKDFARPQWKKLMKDLEANKKTIDYLIVMKYDRLIRNAAQGLLALEKIEKRWFIKKARISALALILALLLGLNLSFESLYKGFWKAHLHPS